MSPLVGNDVVDLRDPQSQPEVIHPRWDTRVFTPEELRRLTHAASAHRARWKMWAAKESAFKVAKKLVPDLSFFPTSFVVDLRSSTAAHVRHEVGCFDVLLSETNDWVQAVATPVGSPAAMSELGTLLPEPVADSGERLIGDEWPREASLRVRALARCAIGFALEIDPAEIDISGGRAAPVVSSGGVGLPVDVSLSHHGRFVACAWVCRSE